jgi:hypothetical protein
MQDPSKNTKFLTKKFIQKTKQNLNQETKFCGGKNRIPEDLNGVKKNHMSLSFLFPFIPGGYLLGIYHREKRERIK